MSNEVNVGQKVEVSKTISETDVYLFAGITGDFNDYHVNKIEAEKSVFGKRIVHGILVSGMISNAIGMKLPGPGTIYMEQDLKFKKPVFIGDTVTAEVQVEEIISKEKGIVRLLTQVYNQNKELVIDGFAIVKTPKGGVLK